jgi:hypothetical protein
MPIIALNQSLNEALTHCTSRSAIIGARVKRQGRRARRPDVDVGYFEFLSGQYRSAFPAGINQ